MCVILAESLRFSLRNLRDTLDTYEIEEAAVSNLTWICLRYVCVAIKSYENCFCNKACSAGTR